MACAAQVVFAPNLLRVSAEEEAAALSNPHGGMQMLKDSGLAPKVVEYLIREPPTNGEG
jgi:hypothetical protein|eukprot:SAG25_NODE_517_length_7266_cov_10.792242_2_plen_59_part_00